MLVLTRKRGEQIQIGTDITITVLEQHGQRTKLGIEAPRRVLVNRVEVTQRPNYRPGRQRAKPAATTPLSMTRE